MAEGSTGVADPTATSRGQSFEVAGASRQACMRAGCLALVDPTRMAAFASGRRRIQEARKARGQVQRGHPPTMTIVVRGIYDRALPRVEPTAEA
ncbi:hypothetical protein J4558_24235 [Leptolyngbya sp. 15MV]|nr:hypothetical protein J4558_24235 [Leptolyngbya sp. 15MV]